MVFFIKFKSFKKFNVRSAKATNYEPRTLN